MPRLPGTLIYMGSTSDTRRRWFGAVFLTTALGMLIAGETVLRDRLGNVGFVVFWMVCFLLTCLALLIAFLDAAAVRRRAREEHREFLEKALKDIVREKEAKSRQPRNPTGSSR